MNILERAHAITTSDRPSVYGHPLKHFTATAAMVTAYLQRRGLLKQGAELLPEDWSQIMVLDKVSRQAGALTASGQIHLPTAEDQAGYARTSEMLEEGRLAVRNTPLSTPHGQPSKPANETAAAVPCDDSWGV